jgi:hypothetical protein
MKLFWVGIFFVPIVVILAVSLLIVAHIFTPSKNPVPPVQLNGTFGGTITNGFEQTDWRLSHDPLICSFEPTPAKSDTVKTQTLLYEARYSIIDWNQKLNEGLGKHPSWVLTHRIIPISEQYDSKFYSNCDIIIRYLTSYSEDAVHYGLYKGGITNYDYNTNKAYIKIFFSDMNQYELGNAIRHEIGHAIGLGHYHITSDEQTRINRGLEDSPSIMSPQIAASNFYTISPIDINEIKRIYGLYGFHIQNYNTSNSTIPLWIKNDAIDCCSTHRGLYTVDSVLLRDMTVTGLIKSNATVFADGVDSTHSLRYQFFDHFKDYTVNDWINGTTSDKQFLGIMQDLSDHEQLIK